MTFICQSVHSLRQAVKQRLRQEKTELTVQGQIIGVTVSTGVRARWGA